MQTTLKQKLSTPSFVEFVALAAMMTSMAALSIDAVLPALPDMGRELGVQRANDNQLVITLLFLGMAVGQMIYGPLSDSTGRRPAIFAGFGLFIVGTVTCLVATTFPVLLAGRVMQGLGAAGPRIVTLALVRDQYGGRSMARVMSFVMTIFILVPVIAPALGQGLLLLAHWRAIFVAYLLLASITLLWFALRQPETLQQEKRRSFSIIRIGRAIGEVLRIRVAFGYTLAAGLISGAFLGYLNSSQQILQEQYALGTRFPLYFAVLALSLGSASFVNGRLVMRYGMRALARTALFSISGLSLVFLLLALGLAGQPPLWLLMLYLLLSFFGIGILFGNLNSMAMEPLGHIAGVGAAVVGSLSTLIAMMLGAIVGQSYNGTVLPLVGGFLLFSLASLTVMFWVE